MGCAGALDCRVLSKAKANAADLPIAFSTAIFRGLVFCCFPVCRGGRVNPRGTQAHRRIAVLLPFIAVATMIAAATVIHGLYTTHHTTTRHDTTGHNTR